MKPGETATLIWYGGEATRPDGGRLYQVTGPVLDAPPASPNFLLAPTDRGDFAHRLYRDEASVEDLRSFLASCILANGVMDESLELLATRVETPVLPLLDAWRALPDRPRLPYLADIDAFLPEGPPVHVTNQAHAAAQKAPEFFGTAWVCETCEAAEDHGAFLWTVHGGESVRVCFLIQNEAGLWTCTLHPFEFPRELS